MSGVDPRILYPAEVLRSLSVSPTLARSQDSRAETNPQPGAVTGETGVPSVDTHRNTATLTRLRDASRRHLLAAHEANTEIRRARAEGIPDEDILAAVRVARRFPGVPS